MGNDCMQPLRWLAALVQATAKDTDTVTIAGVTRTVGDLLDEADAALEPQPQAEQQGVDDSMVDRVIDAMARAGLQPPDKPRIRLILAAALAAHQPAGEPVEYQYRFWNEEALGGKGSWSSWMPIRKSDYDREFAEPSEGREVRALYTAPPASAAVPVDAEILGALRRMDGIAMGIGASEEIAQLYNEAAVELAGKMRHLLSSAPQSAPPQGVDLGQLRIEVQRLRRRSDPVVGEKSLYVKLDDVLALIDSKAVRNG